MDAMDAIEPLDFQRFDIQRMWQDPEYWAESTGMTEAGEILNHSSCLQYSPVWQAVNMISGDVARLPLHLYRRFPDDRLEKAYQHPAYKVFAFRPNSEDTAFRFWRRLMTQVLIWGAGYVWLRRAPDGSVLEAAMLLSDRTKPVRLGRGLWFQTEIDGQLWPVPAYDCLYFEGLNLSGLGAVDLVVKARESWAAGLAAIKFASKFFGRGGRMGGILEVPAGTSQTAVSRIEEGFRKAYENSDAAFQTVVLRENAKFHMAQSTFLDAQLVEGRREAVRDVARFFNLKPSRLGEESASSYNSKAEDNRDYLDTTLAPLLTMIASELNNKTLSDKESWPVDGRSPRLYWEHNTNALLQMDTLSRYQAYQIGIQSMFLNPNDVRRAENMNPRPGGDQFVNPNTSSPASSPASDGVAAAFTKLIDEQAQKFVAATFDKLNRKMDDGPAFQQVIEDADVDQKLLRTLASVLQAYHTATSRNASSGLLEAYHSAVQDRLDWILDHVPPAALSQELARVRTEATADLSARIKQLIEGESDATE